MAYVPVIILPSESHHDYVCTAINNTTSYCQYVYPPIDWIQLGIVIGVVSLIFIILLAFFSWISG